MNKKTRTGDIKFILKFFFRKKKTYLKFETVFKGEMYSLRNTPSM